MDYTGRATAGACSACAGIGSDLNKEVGNKCNFCFFYFSWIILYE